MSNLRLAKRLLAGLAALLFAVCVLLPHHAAAAPVAAVRASVSYVWTPALAHRFPGCEAHVQGVASGFVVERLSGQVQRMGFEQTWRRTHDEQAADDVWVLGQCL